MEVKVLLKELEGSAISLTILMARVIIKAKNYFAIFFCRVKI